MDWLEEMLQDGGELDERFFDNIPTLDNDHKLSAFLRAAYDLDDVLKVNIHKLTLASLRREINEGTTDQRFFEILKILKDNRISPPPKAVWEMGQKEMANHIKKIAGL